MRIYKIFRTYDILLSTLLIIVFFPILVFVFIICFFESRDPIFIQRRIGMHLKPFKLFKFRTMKKNTPSKASHLIDENSVTRFGRIIRLLKLDELPQLINVLNGDMSLVGPRPCLPNQLELIKWREKYNLYNVKPGITGLSQIKGIDMSDPEKLAQSDFLMISRINQIYYFKYLLLTFFGKGRGDKVKK
mgnify:CR=1 FL=1